MLRRTLSFVIFGLLTTSGFAKDKNKNVLPAYILAAHTVEVVIDPSAGISVDDPRANEVARKDVETALLNWGRLDPTLGGQNADLIIVIRKGNGRFFNETIPDARQNNRAGSINPIDNGVAVGAQRGSQPSLSDDASTGTNPRTAGPQTEIGESEDSFVVYQGRVDHPLDAAPAWRYRTKDGLVAPAVPAVSAFRKAIADAEKAAAKKP